MTLMKTSFAALTASMILVGGTAMADGHAAAFDADTARLDLTLDTNGDGDVSDLELIDGNVAVFDKDGDGVLNAQERGEAEIMVKE
ncbi:MAG: hypothetical protein ACSHW1_20065 [Yoonia sp.]|uniref:hypothetical protein n=1 Tax=Yoonia sp. TaxID=2212373 RepID=UPI003EFB03D7